MADKSVTISDAGNGNLMVSNPDVPVSKSGNDQVLWTSQISGKTCTITFTESPFPQSTYSVTPPATTPSRPVNRNAANKSYKYSVSCPGYNTLDPNVIVNN